MVSNPAGQVYHRFGAGKSSYLIVGENTGSAVQLKGEWSPWIRVLPSAQQWDIRLESITVRNKTYGINKDIMLDSGTSYSYFPAPACEALNEALDGRLRSNSSTRIYPRNQPNETIKFQFNGLSVERCFSDMLDPRPNTESDPTGGPSTKPTFKPIGTLTRLGVDLEICILGNGGSEWRLEGTMSEDIWLSSNLASGQICNG
ncbi:hypothetical protein B0H14DRAFT_2624591 [Mycena olivaceomarginata]|nr:hypothetical protein B0H14DRAFT_2624591 [Mycena olivaceomarginata]